MTTSKVSEAEGSPRKTTAVKSTETARQVSALIKQFYARAQEAARNDEPIAWCKNGVAHAGPYEVRGALGIASFYPEHYAALCSAE